MDSGHAILVCIGIFINLIHIGTASFCGEAAIPFSFEVLPDGHSVLGCARPSCFGWDAFGRIAHANESSFYRVNSLPDGFFRKALASTSPKPLSDKETIWHQTQTAVCSNGFKRSRCSASGLDGHWVGGIAPTPGLITGESPLLLRCCRWGGLAHSIDRGIATVRNGQIVYGGEVMHGERQYAFDYVSDVVRSSDITEEKKPFYEVSIFRMPCLPRPEHLSVRVESGVLKEMLHKFTLAVGGEGELLKQKDAGKKQSKEIQEVRKAATSQKQRHTGESHVVIETAKWTALPVDNEQGHPSLTASDVPNIPRHQNKALAAPNAPIQGPFVENEVEMPSGRGGNEEDYDTIGQEYGQQYIAEAQNPLPIQQQYTQQQLQQRPTGGAIQIVGKKRIICDRNMTLASRAKRQACVEIEAPEGTEVQVNDGSYYDPQPQQTYWYQQPSYYSTQGGTLRYCFTGDTRVRLANGRQLRMDELEVGEWVYAANGSHLVYSIVESWIHRIPNQWADFIRIQLDDGRILKLTAEHFIYKRSNCLTNYNPLEPVPIEKVYAESKLVYAKDVRAGDCLFVQNEDNDLGLLFERPVLDISIVREQGIYAPMTGTGDILVEGVLASCFAVESSGVLQKSVFTKLKSSLMDTLFGYFGENTEVMDLPGWLHFAVEYLMPIVLPK